MNITVDDMLIRDERLLAYIIKTTPDKSRQITSNEIAKSLNCCPKTSLAMLKRLKSAGYIKIKPTYRGGNWITVL